MDFINYKHPFNVIYVYSIDDQAHKGAYKIGKTSINLSLKELATIDPVGEEIKQAGWERVKHQCSQAGVNPQYHFAELAYSVDEDGNDHYFDDNRVQAVLINNGRKRRTFPDLSWDPKDWIECTLEDIHVAIRTIKSGHSIMPKLETQEKTPIQWRDEQIKAIKDTIDQFAKGDKMLWNAKMRFGKTLCSLELIRKQQYGRTLIVTHRPAVRSGWFEDFRKLDFKGYSYGSKLAGTNTDDFVGERFETLQKDYKSKGTKYIYFASMQDLRGGDDVKKGGIDKNHEIFSTPWDLIIVDEAHEGTQTSLGKNVLDTLIQKKPKVLYLSGTPYNILKYFETKEIFTWDYNMEQAAKQDWPIKHPNEPNKYEELPALNIRTYRLRGNFEQYYSCEDDYFNFAELFRTWTGDKDKDSAEMPTGTKEGTFIHEADVRAFLDLMHKSGTEYPFSKEDYIDLFAHTFWVLPGVKAAKALSTILQEKDSWWQQPEHKFEIVNVAGDGDDPIYDKEETKAQVLEREKKERDALNKVKATIAKNKRTITLSCGRLTTGVTVKQWTGVFMLKGNGETKAAFYMQTIFRAQSPMTQPYLKTNCYAFDFAPDRTLTVIDEYLSVQPNNRNKKERPKETVIKEFLKFCSVISIDESSMIEFDTKSFITNVNRAYKDFIIKHGFSGRQLYVDLYQLTPQDQKLLEDVAAILVKGKATDGKGKVDVSKSGTNTEGGAKQTPSIASNKSDKQTKEKKQTRDRYLRILDIISIRLPMMVFGSLTTIENFSMTDFVNSIQEESWKVFMPKDITKSIFLSLIHLYNTDALLASFEEILKETHAADELPIAQRVAEMARILSVFRFPDKETVLTPWKVVNLHMTTTIGGFDFFNETHDTELQDPRFVDKDEFTRDVFQSGETKILEINSKSGIYPLWIAYTLFRYQCDKFQSEHHREPDEQEQLGIWRTIISKNIYVLCMSPMAQIITERVLRGYHEEYETNCHYEPELVEQLKVEKKKEDLLSRIQTTDFWKKGNKNMPNKKMNFSAVVGNPPYQGNSSAQLYPLFYLSSIQMGESVSLIFPTGWQKPCAPTAKGLARMNKEEIKADQQIVEINVLHNVFNGVSGAAEVNTVFWKRGFDNGLDGKQRILTDSANPREVQLQWDLSLNEKPKEIREIESLVKKSKSFKPLSKLVSSRSPYGLDSDAFVKPEKYNIEPIVDESPKHRDDLCIYGIMNRVMRIKRYVRNDYQLPKRRDDIDKYKIFIPNAWGNMSDAGLGGSFGDIILAYPNEICTQTYNVSGCFEKREYAEYHAKYLFTKFARALLYANKHGRHASNTAFASVPVQDYSEPWWNKTIAEIDEELFAKYNLPSELRDFIRKNIQTRDESSIINL